MFRWWLKPFLPAAFVVVLASAWLNPFAGTASHAAASGGTPAASHAPTNQVRFFYLPVKNPVHAEILRRLRERRVLEDLRDFLAPLRLPNPLTIQTAVCGSPNASYDQARRTITICYELIDQLHKLIPDQTNYVDVSHEDAVIGAFVDVVLHEVAHALFHILEIPILGREEDAADQIAALILLQFGEKVARRTIIGAVLYFRGDAAARREQRELADKANKGRGNALQVDAPQPGSSDPRQGEFASVHGLPEQRYVNVLCIAYARHRNSFKDFVNSRDIPMHRLVFCGQEYAQIARAYHTLIEPHVDPVLLEGVLNRIWLPSSADLKK